MMKVIIGLIVTSVLAVFLLQWWLHWRKRTIIEAGAIFGFCQLAMGESLKIVPVPLFDRPKCIYLIILRGFINGYEAAFFDLLTTNGADWNFQSTVMLRNPKVMMSRFQLQTIRWSQPRQKTCGDALDIPGRSRDMASLRLSADDPDWARGMFSRGSTEFFQKLRSGKWTIEGLQDSLIIYRWGARIPARKLHQYVHQANELASYVFSLITWIWPKKRMDTDRHFSA